MASIVVSSTTQRMVSQLSSDLGQGSLLYGPLGIGLATLAHSIARKHTNEIITVTPDAKGTISIDSVRELYTLARSKAHTMVFIIEDADGMGREAQNALLKLLEEPIATVHFILTSHTPDALLPTIRSRVAHFRVTPISAAQSASLVTSLNVTDPTKKAQLLFIAEGLPAALTLYATNDTAFAARSSTVRDARAFLQGSKEDRLVLTVQYKDRQQAVALLKDMQKLMRRSIEANPSGVSSESIDALLVSESALRENASVRLTLTSLALTL